MSPLSGRGWRLEENRAYFFLFPRCRAVADSYENFNILFNSSVQKQRRKYIKMLSLCYIVTPEDGYFYF